MGGGIPKDKERIVVKCRAEAEDDSARQEFNICTLIGGVVESASMDLMFSGYAEFCVEGKHSVHLTGYLMPEDFDDDSMDGDGMRGADGDQNDDDDDDDDEEGDEDDSEDDPDEFGVLEDFDDDSEEDEDDAPAANKVTKKGGVVISEVEEEKKPVKKAGTRPQRPPRHPLRCTPSLLSYTASRDIHSCDLLGSGRRRIPRSAPRPSSPRRSPPPRRPPRRRRRQRPPPPPPHPLLTCWEARRRA